MRHISGINITDIVRNCFSNLGTYSSWNTGILTSIDFPNVITIGENAFNSCYNLSYANIPKVQIIKSQAFYYCLSLQSLFIPDISFIGYVAFVNTKLTEFVLGEVAPKMDYVVFGFPSAPVTRTITVKVPQGATGYGEIPNGYIGGDTSKNWGNAFRGMGWNPDRANMPMRPGSTDGNYDSNGFGTINYIMTGITLRIEYIP